MDNAPPYTHLSVPVYSLATPPGPSGRASMNIHTFATPVTIKPTRRMVIALYHDTLSYENMVATGRGVLQILRREHVCLAKLLGKTSGRDVDKLAELERLGHPITDRFGVRTLADCLGAVELELVGAPMDAGDHAVALCEVRGHWTAPELLGGTQSGGAGGGGGSGGAELALTSVEVKRWLFAQ